MKHHTTITTLKARPGLAAEVVRLLPGLSLALSLLLAPAAIAQDTTPPEPPTETAPAQDEAQDEVQDADAGADADAPVPAEPDQATLEAAERAADEALAALEEDDSGPDLNGKLVMNFKDATLETILDYLSEEAGMVVINGIDLDERVSITARQPVTLDESIDLLNTLLKDQGYTAIRRGRLLRVVRLEDAARMRIPVRYGNNPQNIRETDTVITQIVPIQYADAQGIAENLEGLVSEDFGQLTFNEASNALIITDVEGNIRRIVEIVQALDQSISQVTTVQVFKLEYAQAEEVADLVEEVFESGAISDQVNQAIRNRFRRFRRGGDDDDDEGSGSQRNRVVASADERTNTLVVSAAPEVMETIADVIADLDTDSTAKESVLIYQVKNMEAAELADLFNGLFESNTGDEVGGRSADGEGGRGAQVRRARGGGDNGAAAALGGAADLTGQVVAVANNATNSLVVRTQEKNFARIEDILAELDRPIPQVLIRVLVSEVTYDDSLDLGVEFQAINTGTGINGDEDTVFTDFNLFESTLGLNYLLLDSTNFRMAVRALQGTGRFDVLSRPYLLTADNQEASISVGQRVPFVTDSQTTDTGNTTTTIDYEDVGIILTVTPQINDDGLVVLNIEQELSALTENSIPINEDLDAVILNQRTVTTQVAVANAQTVVVGGLMQDELQENVNKVPLLGDIPIVGNLFRRTQRTKVKTELLVFLTPEVILDPADLSRTSQRLTSEAEGLQDAVEPGLLKRHLERMRVVDPEGDTQTPGDELELTEPEEDPAPDALEGALP